MSKPERRAQIEDMFRAHSSAVLAYALRRIDPASAEETVSEVFAIAWRRLDEIPADALPWLLACARRVLANQRRASRRRRALLERMSAAGEPYEAPGPGEGATVEDRSLARALMELSEGDRELLLLLAWEQLEPERAAQALGCSRRTLAVRLYRARRRLAHALARVQGNDTPTTAPTTMESLQ
jgi:RNA polymerase sigma-70 factor, ECF subfamily